TDILSISLHDAHLICAGEGPGGEVGEGQGEIFDFRISIFDWHGGGAYHEPRGWLDGIRICPASKFPTTAANRVRIEKSKIEIRKSTAYAARTPPRSRRRNWRRGGSGRRRRRLRSGSQGCGRDRKSVGEGK